MKNLIILPFVFILSLAFGQTETVNYKTVANKFEINYNSGNSDTIFAMFSPGMQNFLPSDKTKDYITNTRKQLGNLLRKEFRKYDKTSAVYLGYFENGLFDITISIDNNSKISVLIIRPYEPDGLIKPDRNQTSLSLPFKGEWTVVWGGDTKELNYHVESISQKNAFDILITNTKGRTFKTDGKSNEDYYAFGKEISSPCDGEIVSVVDGVKDNAVNEMNSFDVGGNTVILKTAKGEFLVFCHLKHQSITVKEGQKVKQGQILGQCGNSGHSSEPHLHFHIQNTENMNIATGIKCYFNNLIVNGQRKMDYSPIQKDKIKSE